MSNSDNEVTTGDVETEDPYAVVSETTEDDDFVKAMEDGGDTFVELPKEDDGTIMMSTLQGQFPNAAGLKYKSSSGGWRGVRITDNCLNPPHGGWGDTTYHVTFNKTGATVKKPEKTEKAEKTTESPTKADNEDSEEASEEELLQDLFVLHLPREATDDDLKEYFTKNCGDMALAEVKHDRVTGKSRGFGFIRFKSADAAKEALNGDHVLMDQKLEVRVSRKKETPCQLFVGRLPEGSTKEDLEEYFAQYGKITDAYITSPFRGFGFVTYASVDIARSILRLTHEIKGTRLNVAVAKPKEEKEYRGRGGNRRFDDNRGGDSRRRGDFDVRDRSRHDRRDDSRRSRYDSPPRSQHAVHEFKDMLYDLFSQRR